MKYLISIAGALFLFLPTQAQTSIDRNRVMEYFQEQQYDAAISYMQPVLSSNDLKELSLLAYALHQSGRLKDAAGIYERILVLDSNATAALQSLAGIRLQQNLYPAALILYGRLTRLRPGNAYVLKQLSTAAYALGQADSGFAWLNRSYQLNPADEKVVMKLAEHWIDREKYEVADSLISAYGRVKEPDMAMQLLAVKTAYLLKHYERVIAIGDQMRAQQVILPSAYTYVTAACYRLKRYKDCIALCDYLDQHNMTSEHISYYAALASTELKEFKKSNLLLERCIAMAKSDMLETYYHCSSINYESMKQFKPALACLDSSYYLSGQTLRLYSMGRIYENGLNNTTAAKKYYKRFLQMNKNSSSEEKAIYDYLQERMKHP